MKPQIGFTKNEFVYRENWPEFEDFHSGSLELRQEQYNKTIASAMGKGIKFEPQEKIWLLLMPKEFQDVAAVWKPKEGDHWDCPDGVIVEEQWALKGTQEWYGEEDERFNLHHPDDTDYRQIAHLKPTVNNKPEKVSFPPEAWQVWQEDSKTNPNPVNPYAFVYGYNIAKKKYSKSETKAESEKIESESQEELWKKLEYEIAGGITRELKSKFHLTRTLNK